MAEMIPPILDEGVIGTEWAEEFTGQQNLRDLTSYPHKAKICQIEGQPRRQEWAAPGIASRFAVSPKGVGQK